MNICLKCRWWDGERKGIQKHDEDDRPIQGKFSKPEKHRGRCMVRPPVVVVCHESNGDHPEWIQYETHTLWPSTQGDDGCKEWSPE
jgi:hypothetical protein